MMNLCSLSVPFLKREAAFRSIQKHRDVRQGSQTKYLSPPGQINHDVISRARSPATNECRRTTLELVDFHKQLNDLRTVGSIRPTETAVSDHSRVVEKHQTKTSTKRERYRQTLEVTHVTRTVQTNEEMGQS